MYAYVQIINATSIGYFEDTVTKMTKMIIFKHVLFQKLEPNNLIKPN